MGVRAVRGPGHRVEVDGVSAGAALLVLWLALMALEGSCVPNTLGGMW